MSVACLPTGVEAGISFFPYETLLTEVHMTMMVMIKIMKTMTSMMITMTAATLIRQCRQTFLSYKNLFYMNTCNIIRQIFPVNRSVSVIVTNTHTRFL
jgi:hypothetical protein